MPLLLGYQKLELYSPARDGSPRIPALTRASLGGGKNLLTAWLDKQSSETAIVFSFCGTRNRSARYCPNPLTM